MPVVETVDAPMRFCCWSPASAMKQDRFGIPVPAHGDTIVPDVVLLPLVAFDPQGFRLGYGGGYFDRTLASMVPRPMAIGVGFELARVVDTRPQHHDLPLDAVVTEAGVERYG
jgi:5,10-methenyltetrahydrofolate synthetase